MVYHPNRDLQRDPRIQVGESGPKKTPGELKPSGVRRRRPGEIATEMTSVTGSGKGDNFVADLQKFKESRSGVGGMGRAKSPAELVKEAEVGFQRFAVRRRGEQDK